MMDDYQSIYDKIINELRDLEKQLDEAEDEYNENARSYQDIKFKKEKIEKRLNVLFEEKNLMTYNASELMSAILAIFLILTFISLVIVHGFLSFKLGNYLQSIFLLTTKGASFASAISMAFGIISMGCIEIVLFKKIDKYLSKKIYNHIVNSDKYQDILKRISSLEDELAKVNEEELVSQTQLSTSKDKYQKLLSDVSMKMSLKNYVEGLMNSENQNVEKRPYTRRRIINGNDNGNIE